MQAPAPSRPPLRFALTIVDGRAVLAGTPGRQDDDRSPPRFGRIERISLEVPGLRFPFDLSLGPRAFQSRRCRLIEFVYAITPAEIGVALNAAGLDRFGLDQIEVRLVDGGLRLAVRARVAGHEAELTCKVRFEARPGGGWRLALRDARTHGFLPVPAPLLLAALPASLGLGEVGNVGNVGNEDGTPVHFGLSEPPLVRMRGMTEWDVDVAGLALTEELVTIGFRQPERFGLVSEAVEMTDGRLVFRLRAEVEIAAAPPHHNDDDDGVGDRGLAALAEVALCAGEVRAAAEGFRRALAAEPDSDFARERLLQLLATFSDARDDWEALADQTLAANQAGTDPGLALITKALAADSDERATEAVWLFTRVAAAAAAAGEALDEAAARLAVAEVATKAGDDESALAAIERALELRPDHVGAREARERLLGARRDDLGEGPG